MRPNVYIDEGSKRRNAELKDNFAAIQALFMPRVEKSPETLKKQMKETETMIKEVYTTIRKEQYDILVGKGKRESNEEWGEEVEEPTNCHQKKLEERMGGRMVKPYPAPPISEKKKTGMVQKRSTWLKPDIYEDGKRVQRLTMDIKKIDSGDFAPPMTHWVNAKQSITSDDQLKLTHMPYFEATKDDINMYLKLSEIFPDGINGFAYNYSYINNWLMYKVFRSVLEKYRGEPDILYYSLYRVWPNKFSQREFSQMFPKLCELYAEEGFNWLALEPWKADCAEEKRAENVQRPECYACFSYACPRHGFSKQATPDFQNGDFATVYLPLPCSDDDAKPCGDDCWMTIDPRRIMDVLTPDDEEIAVGRVTIHLEKANLAQMAPELGAVVAANYTLIDKYESENFCRFAENCVDPEESCIKTCRDAYQLIVKLAEFVSDRRLEKGKPNEILSKSERVNAFRKHLQRPIPRKSLDELKKIAHKTGRTLLEVEEEEDKRVANQRGTMEPNKPIHACRHLGPCSKAPDCACRENRICSVLCQCDINCRQRFPGCNCGPGQCQSNQCQCYFGNWECSPLTCTRCGCDGLDVDNACKNFPMTRMLQKRMMCAPSKIAGNGLFLLESVEKDEFIIEYLGEKISDDEAERRGAIYDHIHCSYIFNLATGGAIDSFKVGNVSRFANHDSKNPSMGAKTKIVAGEHRIGFYAKRKLDVGDELTFDYGYFGEHKVALKHVSPMKKARKSLSAVKPGSSSDSPSTSSSSSSSSSAGLRF